MDRTLGNPAAALRIDGARLWQSLMALARVGATAKGGVCRLALSDADREGRDLVVSWAREAGLAVTVDAIGNVFMRREGRAGRNPALPPVMAGSHIDTQPTGGKFDGNYGVLAALEVVRTLNDHHVETDAPIEVAFWTNEEGSRFVPVMMGSGVFAGAVPLEHAWAAVDLEGRTVRAELERIGYLGTEAPGRHPVGAYFEAHIEQGPVLEDAGITIGAVTGVLGIRWYDCTVTGMEAHAGPTPMALRRDALQVATTLMQEVPAIAARHPPNSTTGRGTVGQVLVHPNSRNVIPGRVRFSVDLRNASDALCDATDADLRECAARLAAESGLEIELQPVSGYPAQPFDAGCIAAVEAAASRLGHRCMRIVSGAGHDAVYMARLAPTGMIFVPCKDGISHNEIEDARPEHLAAGCDVLLQVMLERARVVAAP
jgi:N-carbamoyl-L-amino-acid hydrolase